MLSRKTTITNSILIAVCAVPLVWLIGYQEHRWRNSTLAMLAGVLLVGASVALMVVATDEKPPVSRGWPRAALAAALISFVLAWAWGFLG